MNYLFTVTFGAKTEMVISRIAEIVTESLPSGIMQVYAFLLAKEKSKAAATSIVISAMTTSFAGTVISWDLDTSPANRKWNPLHFGYVKNDPTSRTLTFSAMFLLTFSHVLMKTISASLLMSVSGTWLVIYIGGDMLLYLILKAVRGDFRYWINLSNKLSSFQRVAAERRYSFQSRAAERLSCVSCCEDHSEAVE